MPAQKRPRSPSLDRLRESQDATTFASDDENVDIGDALLKPAKRARLPRPTKVGADMGDDDDADFIANLMTKHNVKTGTDVVKQTKSKKGKVAKDFVGGGSFQSMGLHPSLLRALLLRGYRQPTPIQRLAIPSLLASPPQDLVGMARTGSGKTLAYMIPLIQRLGGRHQPTFGARALVLIPTRELALQILKVGKDLARGWTGGGGDTAGASDKASMGLRWGLVVGGEGLDEQFEMITGNPDVIIATPGRLLHLIVEMNLDFKSVNFVVFDEADRLFEQGFETALHELLHRLPSTRQTLLFSATLPKTLVEFTKAGLQDPKFVRLDADSKISTDLRMSFLRVRHMEKDAALLALLRDVLKIPFGVGEDTGEEVSSADDKAPARTQQAIIFAATKHHIEYLSALLTSVGYSVSHIYGSLDQTARSMQMSSFRRGLSKLLVVTDVAARGIDIPVLENVVNYDFPAGARIFVHRVGRTARAGRKGWAWSLVTNTDLPYLLDLQLFLGRPIKSLAADETEYTTSLVLGSVPRDILDDEIEYMRQMESGQRGVLGNLREVMRKGHGMYERTKGKASHSSYERAKALVQADPDGKVHPMFLREEQSGGRKEQLSRAALMQVVNSFTPSETILEIGNRGKTPASLLMKDRRTALGKVKQRLAVQSNAADQNSESRTDERAHITEVSMDGDGIVTSDEDEDLAASNPNPENGFQDPEYFMSHYQKDAVTDKGYSLRDGATFLEQARTATFDLTTDEGVLGRQRHGSQLNWDRKKKKFVKGSGEGADNMKIVKTESGARLPATYRSGRFEEWKAKSRVSLPRVGEAEPETTGRKPQFLGGGKKFQHHKTSEAKPLDPKHINYERKLRQNKSKFGAAEAPASGKLARRPLKGGAYPAKAGPGRRIKSELKTVDQIRRSRDAEARKKARNARPSSRGRSRR